MKIAAIIGGVAVVAVIAAAFVIWRSRQQRPAGDSFWDVVRNPKALDERAHAQRELDEVAQSLGGSPAKIAQLVDRVVFETDSSDERYAEMQILTNLGAKTYPRALEILGDPALKDQLCVLTKEENSLPEAPIMRLCELFDRDTPPPAEAASLLAPFLEVESERIRQSIALVLGSLGSTASLDHLRRAIADEDADVRSYALIGIQRSIAGNRIGDSAKGEIFSLVSNMWPADTDYSVCSSLPEILLKLDRRRATEFLLQDELLTLDFRGLDSLLSAVAAEELEVPRGRLLDIITSAEKQGLKYPLDNVVESALPLLGSHRDPQDLSLLERFLDHENEEVSQGAIVGLYRYHRYYDQIRNPWDVVRQDGWHALTQAETYICALGPLDSEVRNGGFAQYYFNSSGGHCQDALHGLQAIGAVNRHRVMQATIERFGAAQPSADRKTRQEQLAKLVRGQQAPFADQDSAWYELKGENLDRLLFKYNMAHLAGRQKPKASALK